MATGSACDQGPQENAHGEKATRVFSRIEMMENKPNDVDLIIGERQRAALDAIRDYNEVVNAANTLFPHEPIRVGFRIELDRNCEMCGQRF